MQDIDLNELEEIKFEGVDGLEHTYEQSDEQNRINLTGCIHQRCFITTKSDVKVVFFLLIILIGIIMRLHYWG